MTDEIPGTGGPGSVQGMEHAHALSHPNHAREWLASFRELDAGRQRTHLLAVLRDFCAQPQYDQETLDAVTEIDQAWLRIATDLQQRFPRDPAAVTDNPTQFHREMSELSLAFGEIYSGFARVISFQTKVNGMPDVRLPKVAARALFHFGKHALFLNCINALPEDPHWKSLHGLYTLAADGGFAAEQLALFPNGEVVTTCTQLWLRTLMLATTGGAGLTPRQLYRAEEWLQDWCMRITVDSVYDESLHVYCVDVTSALGPQRIVARLKLATPLYLGTKHLSKDISAARTRMFDDSMMSSFGLYADNPLKENYELPDRLQRIWLSAPSMMSRRPSERTSAQAGEQVEVVYGFEGILAAATGAAENSARIKVMPVTNRSDMGYGLLASGAESSPPRLRELIAVRTPGTREWQIGVIARTTVLPAQQGCSLGVQLLAQTAIPVPLSKAPPEGASAPGVPEFVYGQTAASPQGGLAFYLIGDASRNRPDSLLAPVGVYVPGDRLMLKAASNAFHISINRVIQRGEDWERTGFQVFEKIADKR